MTNLNFIKILTTGVALSLAFYPQAWAGVATPCGQQAGDTSSNCWSCGDDCSARLDSTGKLSIDGSGAMYDWGWGGTPWYANPNITSAVVGSGITHLGACSFNHLLNLENVDLNGATSLNSIGTNAFRDTSHLSSVTIPPSVKSIGSYSFEWSSAKNVYCPDTLNCSSGNFSGIFLRYKKEGNHYIFFDENNNIVGRWNLDKTIGYDSMGNIISKYDEFGHLIESYKYDGAGNLTAAYENGVSTYKRTSYTPAEAAAAIRKGNNNRITFTFK